MKIKKLFFMLIASSLLMGCGSMASLVDGKEQLSYLKGQEKVDLEFDYSDMSVGDYANEEDYVAAKVKEKNEDEPGSGDEWKKKWKGQKESKLEPKFEELINKELKEETNIRAERDYDDATYRIIVKVEFMEPGWNIGVSKKPAELNSEIQFVKTSNPDDPLTVLEINNVPGSAMHGYDFAASARLAEAYAKTGKELSKYILNHLEG